MNYFFAFAVIFLLVPMLPGALLTYSDNIIVRGLLLLFVVVFAMDNALLGIMALLIVGLVFIQRNKYKIAQVYTTHTDTFMKIDTENEGLKVLDLPTEAVEQPVYDTPAMEVHPFGPGADSGSDRFEAVDSTIDHKVVLPSASVRGADAVQGQLFRDEDRMRQDAMAHDAEHAYAPF
jgi:hypothetical protein